MRDKMKKIFFFLILFSNFAFSQNSAALLDEGNELISKNKFSEAEKIFRKGLQETPNDLILKSQLALALISQEKNEEAETVITEILNIHPDFTAALWYGGINNFNNHQPDYRKAIAYFEKAYNLIDANSGQFFGVNYYIGRSYRKLLYKEGLTYNEVDRMLETYKKYIESQPNAEDIIDAKSFVKKVEEKRPGKNVGKWIITSDQNVGDLLKKKE
jgi:tetratricopeptide (TPR) repeat protein